MNRDEIENILFKKLDDYSVKLHQIDKDHVPIHKRRLDEGLPESERYGPGWGWYPENVSRTAFANIMFGDNNWIGEVPYDKVGGILPSGLKDIPSLDIFSDKHGLFPLPILTEYKKVKQHFNNAKLDSYTLKKITALEPIIFGWVNPETGESIVSGSHGGDVVKVSTLPSSKVLPVAGLEFWGSKKLEKVTLKYLDKLDEEINEVLEVTRYFKIVDGFSTNYNDTVYLNFYIVYGKK